MGRVSAAAHRLRGVYAIVDASGPDPIELTRAILNGGIRIVQYRAKAEFNSRHAHAMRELTRAVDALFILNDHWRAVAELDADGAHLGPDDAHADDLPAIRTELRGRILGLSCGTEAEARAAAEAAADYIGVGCVYSTRSKSDAGEPIGIPGLKRVAAASALPVAAIGGITMKNLPEIVASGVAMAAMLSALSSGDDPAAAARALVLAWNR